MILSLSDIKTIEMFLRSLVKPEETLMQTFERILRERDLTTYNRGMVESATERAEHAERAFFAACLSQPDNTLRINARAIHLVGGPHSKEFELLATDDFANNEKVYVVRRR